MNLNKHVTAKIHSLVTGIVLKDITHCIIGLILYFAMMQSALPACAPIVDRDYTNYWVPGSGMNVASFYYKITPTTSWKELAEMSKRNSEAQLPGYTYVLNSPTDMSRSPLCFKLYINGNIWPAENNIWATQDCGAYFYPSPSMGPTTCPDGYHINTSNGQCDLSSPDTKVCPTANKEPGPPDYCGTGNPINQANGTKYALETDVPSSGVFPLGLKRYYSRARDQSVISSSFGNGWSNTYNRHLSVATVPYGTVGSPSKVMAYRDNGKGINYAFQSATGFYVGDADDSNTLTLAGNEWRYSDSLTGSTEFYDSDGKLLKITAINGLSQLLTYSDSNNNKYPINSPDCLASLPVGLFNGQDSLRCITNEFGAQLNFAYDSIRRIKSVTNPAGAVYKYQYDDTVSGGATLNALTLTSVTYPDNNLKTYLYNEPAYLAGQYAKYTLTGIIDENGTRYATYAYDANGRAISTEHALGVDKYTINYTVNASNTVLYSEVTDPLGSARTHNFDTVQGAIKSIGQSQPAGAGCAASAAALTYDANGNVATRTDFNGNKTTYVYDLSRNLETSRTEGLTSAGTTTAATRTITTTWHPTWRLPLVTSEYNGATATGTALRTTTNVYDAKGNLTSVTEADPVHAVSRTTTITYTYSTAVPGLVLSKVIDGPRTDVNDIRTYNYYPHDATCTPSAATPLIDPITNTSPANLGCRGQLSNVTNALNQTTTYDRYNHHGQVEQMTDANGLVTSYTYDLRQRLLSKIVSGPNVVTQTTNLTYDSVGQVTQLTLPDNSSLNYSYDAAHRLTDVQDSLGNQVHYTLDAAGNRINETTTDPVGTLTKTLNRSYDALNRLQQVIGVQ